MNEAISIKEAALSLNVSPRTVWNYIRKGQLDKVQVKGIAHVTVASMETFSRLRGKPVQEREAVAPGRVVVDITYLEGLLIRLGQLEAEKKYLEAPARLPWYKRIFLGK